MPKKVEYPYVQLKQAIGVAELVRNCGNKAQVVTIADGLQQKITSGAFKMKMSAARLFGLVDGRDEIHLTSLGERIVTPLNEDERKGAMIEAFRKPETFKKLYDRFSGNHIDSKISVENLLTREYGVPHGARELIATAFLRSGMDANLIHKEGDSFIIIPLVQRDSTTPEVTDVSNQEDTIGCMPEQQVRTDKNGFWVKISSPYGEHLLRNLSEDDWDLAKQMLDSLKSKWKTSRQKDDTQI